MSHCTQCFLLKQAPSQGLGFCKLGMDVSQTRVVCEWLMIACLTEGKPLEERCVFMSIPVFGPFFRAYQHVCVCVCVRVLPKKMVNTLHQESTKLSLEPAPATWPDKLGPLRGEQRRVEFSSGASTAKREGFKSWDQVV